MFLIIKLVKYFLCLLAQIVKNITKDQTKYFERMRDKK